MEELDKRKRERMIRAIALNTTAFIAIAIYIFISIMPKYDAIGAVVDEINDVYSKITALHSNGVDTASFSELLTKYGRKKEISDVILSDTTTLNKILKKTGGKDYLDWLVSENKKVPALNTEIQNNERILGNIIPVYANTQSAAITDIGNQITLSSFVSYVEKDILGKYELSSYAPLGLGNVTFLNDKKNPVNIGSFQITLDFKGKNSSILSMVDALQKSGKLTIREGKLLSDGTSSLDNNLSDLSNLLVTIKSLKLEKLLPASSTDVNNGVLVLEFYVEGMNYQKILILRNILVEKFEGKTVIAGEGTDKKTTRTQGLRDNIKQYADLCAKPGNALCNETITSSAVSVIKNLSRSVPAMQARIDVLKKNELVIDVSKEMDTLSQIKNSLDSMELIYKKNADIIEKFKSTIK